MTVTQVATLFEQVSNLYASNRRVTLSNRVGVGFWDAQVLGMPSRNKRPV
jgi:hypothetical protein